ncbi:ABC transporter ATP-binding protein [Chlamydiota bacterium]
MFSLKQVTKKYKQTTVLNQVSLDIPDKELVVFLGPSGSGKTTLLRLIAGFEKPDTGEISINGSVVSNKTILVPPHNRHIGMVFQDLALWPHMSVSETICFCLGTIKCSRDERKNRADRVLEMVKLDRRNNRYPHQLSGGEKQRLALARALVIEPEILLLDEPLGSMDLLLKDTLLDLIKDIHHELGITTIFVTHDPVEAKHLSTSIVVIEEGEIIQAGTFQELSKNPVNEFVRRVVNL